MRLLAFDCCGDVRSAALLADEAVIGSDRATGARRHAEALVPLIDELLAAAGWSYASLDLLAVGRGPGSFTGIRVAVAAGRALALAVDRPVLGIDGRDVLLAAGEPSDARTRVAAIDARRGGLYAAWATTRTVHALRAMTPDDVAAAVPGDLVVRGSGADLLAAAAGPRAVAAAGEIGAIGIAEQARAQIAAGAVPTAGHLLQPLYLRAADAVPRAA